MEPEAVDQDRFAETLRADGFGEAEARSLPPGQATQEHEHPFDVRALVLAGEITLTVGDRATAYRPGDVFAMEGGCRHAEAVGAKGVSYLVGRRPVPAG